MIRHTDFLAPCMIRGESYLLYTIEMCEHYFPDIASPVGRDLGIFLYSFHCIHSTVEIFMIGVDIDHDSIICIRLKLVHVS